MALSEMVILELEKSIKDIKEKNNIINEIIRDDVFSILQECNCTVLYYPLEDEKDGCDGCHIEKPVGDHMEQFVFINTNNTRERQAFTAAHELGHIWKVDENIRRKIENEIIDTEEVTNRFAAELLMPKIHFNNAINFQLRKMEYKGPTIKFTEMVKLIAYLMNYFFVPFKAVVKRLNEVGRLEAQFNEQILVYKDSDYLVEIIKAEQYTRLLIKNQLKSMDNLQEYLQEAEEKGIFNETKIKNIKADFEIREVDEESSEEVLFGE